jgi:Cdc6-like AAA superfamily ATPase
LLLWITGGPGMGKTVLSVAIIDHLLSTSTTTRHPNLIYFYFKGKSSDNSDLASAARSFLYQILVTDKPEVIEKISKDLSHTWRNADQSFSVWWLVCKVLEMLTPMAIVVDGLDECSNSKKWQQASKT